MTMQISNFKIPDYYLRTDVVPSFPMDEGMNALKSSDQQVQLTDRLLEKIDKGSVKLEAIRQSISNLELNLSGSNKKLNYKNILQIVQGENWITPVIKVKESGGYTDTQNNQVHVRLWYLGATNEEEYLQAKPQFEGNIRKLEEGLEKLKSIEKKKSQNSLRCQIAAVASLACVALALFSQLNFQEQG